MRVELNRPMITTPEEIEANILLPHERVYAYFLLSLFPHVIFSYESVRFEHDFGGGRIHTTTPDFHVVYMESGEEQFHEISGAEGKEGYDPKARQRRFMQDHFPDVRYRVFDSCILEEGQEVFPNFDFRSALKEHRSHKKY